MKIFQVFLLLAFLVAPFQARAAVVEAAKPTMTITKAYSFAVPEGTKNAAVFMTLVYATGTAIVPDRLMQIQTPMAGKAELHTMIVNNTVMTMRALESFPLPPIGRFTLKPDGVHIMLMDLKHSLKVGDHFPLTLVFEKAGSVTTDVMVRAAGDIEEPDEEKSVHQDMKMDMSHGHADMKP